MVKSNTKPGVNYNRLYPNQQELFEYDLSIAQLGESEFQSPLKFSNNIAENSSTFVPDKERILAFIDTSVMEECNKLDIKIPAFEKAGPRKKLFYQPGETVSAIVTCGGICPGLNAVIRSIVMMNYYRYNNQRTFGVKYGLAGLIPENGHELQLLTPQNVDEIHNFGGTILGTSRGNQNPQKMTDRLEELGVNILYAVGGDGTQRGAMQLIEEIKRRGLKISIIGIPKTIDNDINYIDKSFGMETAFSRACDAIYAANTEAEAVQYGIGIVKVMGRESGFIAANSTLATNVVNFCLIPELDFEMEGENGFLHHLETRLRKRKHAVIVVAEGAGQHFLGIGENSPKDPSGNTIMGDIGDYLQKYIKDYFKKQDLRVHIKYIDPSYIIRSCTPTPNDSIFCSQLAQMAVHAGMAGKTGLVIGYLNGQFIHLPMKLAVSKRKKIDLNSQLWMSVLEATGQAISFKN